MCTTAHATIHIHVLATSAVHDAPNRTMLTYVRCSTRCVWCWVMVASLRGHQTVNWRSSTAARAVRMGAAAMALVAPLLVALSARGMSPQRVVAAGNPCCLGAGQAQARVVLSCKLPNLVLVLPKRVTHSRIVGVGRGDWQVRPADAVP